MKQVKLNTLQGLARIIAEAMLNEHGHYECLIDGEQVGVVR